MQKKKLNFNLLDVIIVLALALLACGIIWRQELTKQIQIRDTQNTVTVVCGIEPENNTVIDEGDTYLTMLAGNDAIISKSADIEGVIGEIQLRLTAVELESGYYLQDGSKLLVEESYILHSEIREYRVKILSISEVEDEE